MKPPANIKPVPARAIIHATPPQADPHSGRLYEPSTYAGLGLIGVIVPLVLALLPTIISLADSFDGAFGLDVASWRVVCFSLFALLCSAIALCGWLSIRLREWEYRHHHQEFEDRLKRENGYKPAPVGEDGGGVQ